MLRALVSHDEWFVPVGWAMTVLGRNKFSDVVGDLDASYKRDALVAFTSRDERIRTGRRESRHSHGDESRARGVIRPM